MVTRENLLGKLPPYQGKKVLLKNHQSTSDIITEMIQAHKLHQADYDRISEYFWKGNLKDTARYIFNFLKRNVKYSIEPDSSQSVKSPASILATGYYKNGFNDCKHYSQFISGILDSLRRKGKNISWVYRFANYRVFTKQPQHVFVVATDGKNTYWIDPVLKSFDERKPYINKIDKKIMLYSISGTDELNSIAGGIGRRRKSAPGQPRKKRGGIFRKVKNVFAKVNMAPSRAAFLAIIKLNPFKIANKLYESLQNPARKNKLLKKWKNLGGNPKTFEKTIVKQYAHWKKRKKISGVEDGDDLGYIGFVHHIIQKRVARYIKNRRKKPGYNPHHLSAQQIALIRQRWHRLHPRHKKLFENYGAKQNLAGIGAVQLVAVLAVAAPVIAALAEFMPKGMKKKADEAVTQVPEIAQQQAAEASTRGALPAPEGTTRERMNVSQDEGGAMVMKKQGDDEDDIITPDKSSSGGGINKNILYAGGAAAVLYFATRKH